MERPARGLLCVSSSPPCRLAPDRCSGIADVHRADAGGQMGQTSAGFITRFSNHQLLVNRDCMRTTAFI